jgi:hypothetical protein
MSIQAVSELRQRMIEDMKARQLNKHTQRSHIYSCKRFAAYYGDGGRGSRLPALSDGDWSQHLQSQPHHDRREVSTAGHAAQARFSVRDLLRQGAAETAAGYEPG